jgi:hypothetical protein
MIAVIYAMIGGGLVEALIDPTTTGMVKAIMSLFPSSWGAEIFVIFASNPGNSTVFSFEIFTRLGSLILFFIAVLWLGSKVSNIAYSLESITFISPRVKPDSIFYKTIKYFGGGRSFGTLLVSVFKDYGRRLENLSYIAYTVGLIIMLRVFLSDPYTDPTDTLLSVSILAIPMLSAFTVGTVSRGKEKLFSFKKTPLGIVKFVKARLMLGLLVTVPIMVVIIAVSTIQVPQLTLFSFLINLILGSVRTIAVVTLVLGITLIIPVFAEESRERNIGIIINLMIIIFATIGMEIGFARIGLSFEKILPNLDPLIALLYDYLFQTAIFSLVGIGLLFYGIKKLNTIE